MRIAFDTSIVLDVLLRREPHLANALALFAYAHERRIDGLLQLLGAVPADGRVLRSARKLGFGDSEDAALHESARRGRAGAVVTRNAAAFKKAPLTICEAAELLAVIEAPS